jgi:hypothetical protein
MRQRSPHKLDHFQGMLLEVLVGLLVGATPCFCGCRPCGHIVRQVTARATGHTMFLGNCNCFLVERQQELLLLARLCVPVVKHGPRGPENVSMELDFAQETRIGLAARDAAYCLVQTFLARCGHTNVGPHFMSTCSGDLLPV